jgi:uncharacterized cupredoxin-like copper-binding protein
LVHQVELEPHLEDTITWKLTKSGTYSAPSYYKAQS